jgi:hypothetical protein
MDGQIMLQQLSQLLNEDLTTSDFLDTKTSYDFLYEATCEFVRQTGCLTNTGTITTVAGTQAYALPSDFFYLYQRNDRNELYIKINDGTSDYFFTWRAYDAIVYANNPNTLVAIPGNFSITDKQTLGSIVSGTATTPTGSIVLGESVLTASGTTFTSTQIGDTIHNTTDNSYGVVLDYVSAHSIAVALFYGTNDFFTIADAFKIVPHHPKMLYLDYPSSISGYTITFQYVQRPNPPVYALTRAYRVPTQYMPAIIKYAAWLYKYRDREPNYGDAWYKYWDQQLRAGKFYENKAINRTSFSVNMRKRTLRDRSYK